MAFKQNRAPGGADGRSSVALCARQVEAAGAVCFLCTIGDRREGGDWDSDYFMNPWGDGWTEVDGMDLTGKQSAACVVCREEERSRIEDGAAS